MPEISFASLQQAPEVAPDAFVVDRGQLMLNVGAFIGRPVADANDPAVVELVYKLIRVAATAQNEINAGDGTPVPTGQRLAAFTAPAMSAPRLDADGNLYSTATASVVAVLPIEVGPAVSPKQ